MTVDWSAPSWRADADKWIAAQLRRRGLALSGPTTQIHERPWSLVLAVPTHDQSFIFKAVWPPQRHEVVVSALLATWLPDSVPAVIGQDDERGWMLCAHAGTPLAEFRGKSDFGGLWTETLARYGRLQRLAESHVDELLQLGVPDHRDTVALFDDLLLHLDRKRDDALSSREIQSLQELRPRLAQAGAALDASPIPVTAQHDDLHDGNVLVRDGTPRVFDWGDVCIAHPFLSLMLARESMAKTLIAENRTKAPRALGRYLAAWASFGEIDELRRLADLAEGPAMVSRAAAYKIVIDNVSEEARASFPDPVAYWLRRLLDVHTRA